MYFIMENISVRKRYGSASHDPVIGSRAGGGCQFGMDTVQIKGVDSTIRKTTGTPAARAKLVRASES